MLNLQIPRCLLLQLLHFNFYIKYIQIKKPVINFRWICTSLHPLEIGYNLNKTFTYVIQLKDFDTNFIATLRFPQSSIWSCCSLETPQYILAYQTRCAPEDSYASYWYRYQEKTSIFKQTLVCNPWSSCVHIHHSPTFHHIQHNICNRKSKMTRETLRIFRHS